MTKPATFKKARKAINAALAPHGIKLAPYEGYSEGGRIEEVEHECGFVFSLRDDENWGGLHGVFGEEGLVELKGMSAKKIAKKVRKNLEEYLEHAAED